MACSLFVKKMALGVVGLGAIVTLGACGGPTDTATTEPTGEVPMTAETPETTTTTETTGTETTDSIVDVAAQDESFSTLATAIEAAGLTETLSSDGPYTVFAPTNEAFEALPEGTLEQLLEPQNQETLAQILSYHVIPQEVPSTDVTSGDVETVAGPPISIMVDDATGEVMVNDARVTEPDITASNGVIHAIDQVILPPDVSL